MLRTIFSFTLAPLTVATPAELLQIQTGGFDAFLHCRHSKEYRAFYNVLHGNGWHSDETFKFAYNMHNELDLGTGHDELQDLPWHTTLKVSPGAATWMLRQVMLLANFFGVEASANISLSEMMEGFSGQSGDLQEMDCPYGFIALEYAVLIGFQQFGYGQLRDEVASALTASIEILLHAPYYTYDFLASTTWNVSLYDMAVNLDSERNYKSYAEYKEMAQRSKIHDTAALWYCHALNIAATQDFYAAIPRWNSSRALVQYKGCIALFIWLAKSRASTG
eukprot:symbB.v1.2.027464.t1/scaffold2821.1/size70050/10